jgi:DNA-binding winged helix-turn-helix (wHTH) protein
MSNPVIRKSSRRGRRLVGFWWFLMRVRFGDFTFDSERRELLRKDERVPVTPKVFALLEALLAAHPKAIAKRELHDRLWPDAVVLESNLKGLVNDLRQALGEGNWIRTVYGYGYAFDSDDVSHLTTKTPDARRRSVFIIERASDRIRLEEGENIIGREPEARVLIDGLTVSRRHARITVRGAEAVLEDLGSKNGTFIDGRRIDAPSPIHDGEVIGIGSERVTFRIRTRPVTTRTASGR